jgi:hypothetical protein
MRIFEKDLSQICGKNRRFKGTMAIVIDIDSENIDSGDLFETME